MEFEIIFCTDGILRIKFRDKPMIPALFLQKTREKGDFSFWTRFWEEHTYFEDGLTVSQFLSCLAPWAEFWSDLTGKDIQSFIDESKKPVLVKTDEDHPLGWVSLSYQTMIDPVVEYEHLDEDLKKDINAWFNSPENRKLTGQWNIYSSYKLTGYSIGQEEQYGIDYCPMNELANLPIVLDSEQTLVISEYMAKKVLGDNYKEIEGYAFRKIEPDTYIIGEKFHSLRDVVEGFFRWFPSNPKSREDLNESIKESVDTLDEDINIEDEAANSDSISMDKPLKVKVAPGAFDSLIKRSDRMKDFWHESLEKAKRDKDVVLKIGKLKLAQPLEKRFFSKIIKDEVDFSTDWKKD